MKKKLIKVENNCYGSYPCQHYVRIINQDGMLRRCIMYLPKIIELSKDSKYDLTHLRCWNFYEEIDKEKYPKKCT
jgi:hypothetical protein